ncbi:MAG: bifunctional diaminohydroxyphosphoribosylaminopyrimidine deaminase/5-amino-6-(5-phosphoribosylamino)uracil reductase RibD [Bacteroidetes bacterium]|nr:bifunctional diaminohydroxyphosphoribosylaminopyrimidine deaminase/5-amino-6-(5-phosphoribosylamino)uracil reductase RibD [Bacteroidota bacterium]
MTEKKYLHRCFQLALNGIGNVAPNPMVGAVIVYEDAIIGEGFHQKYGQAHAEVNAISNAIENGFENLLSKSTIYVNLEPCSHYGKTPPCCDLIIKHRFKKVVISNQDPFPEVAGNGIRKMMEAGIDVATSVLELEGRVVNKRFFTFYEKKRPYIILKFAQSTDGFIAPENPDPENRKISNELSNKLVHQWRSEESAILVGTRTASIDNPALTVRNYSGKNPVRMVIDKECKLPLTNSIFNNEAQTLIFNDKKNQVLENLEFIKIDFNIEILNQINQIAFDKKILSILVEGGSKIHQQYIDMSLWDEIRTITAPLELISGTKSASFTGNLKDKFHLGKDLIKIFTPNS